jgi:branched-chain amino acid aminotransferase
MDIDWNSLGFAYRDTHCHIRYTWRDGEWDDGQLVDSPYINLHIAATALHYGQAAFEGLKAFSCADGQIRVFRGDENASRLQQTAGRIHMAQVPTDLFEEAVQRVVWANRDFVPPYGTGGALYIRPMLFGSGPQIGVSPSLEYTFIILVLPVGDYYKGGLSPVSALVVEGFDRAAPQGVGHVKVAGNYAADLEPNSIAKKQGYPINLYLDAHEHRYIEEFGTSNFIGITGDNCYVTPDAPSILRSVTNKTLMTLAEENGLTVQQRPVEFSELSNLTEAAACGTAVVITPVNRVVRGDTVVNIGASEGVGPVFGKLYEQVRGIQVGDLEDKHGWTKVVSG